MVCKHFGPNYQSCLTTVVHLGLADSHTSAFTENAMGSPKLRATNGNTKLCALKLVEADSNAFGIVCSVLLTTVISLFSESI